MQLVTYLTFDGTCRDALEFYAETLGGEIIMISPFSDLPDEPGMPPIGPEHANRVLHARMSLGGQILMASDSFPGQPVAHGGYSLSAQFTDIAEAKAKFEAISAGGEVTMPAGPTFWAAYFGVAKDKFGVSWMVNVDLPAS